VVFHAIYIQSTIYNSTIDNKRQPRTRLMLSHRLSLLTVILIITVKFSIVNSTYFTPIIGSTSRSSSSNRILSSHQTKTFYHQYHHHLASSSSDQSSESSVRSSSSNNKKQQQSENKKYLTNVVFKIGYDGTNFNGWSAANDGAKLQNHQSSSSSTVPSSIQNDHLPLFRGRSRSRRNKNRPSGGTEGKVRSVQGAIRTSVARIYGDVDPMRVRVGTNPRCIPVTS